MCTYWCTIHICLISEINRNAHPTIFYNIPVLAIHSGQIVTSTEDAYLLHSTGIYLKLLLLYIHPKYMYRHHIRGKKTTQGRKAI